MTTKADEILQLDLICRMTALGSAQAQDHVEPRRPNSSKLPLVYVPQSW